MRSGNHSAGKRLDDGTWTCSECGAESMDFEMFEEAGVLEECLSRKSEKQRESEEKEAMKALVDAALAEKWIADARSSFEKLGTASLSAGSEYDELLAKILSEPIRWADSDE